eukprot:scaffold1401_cov330-Pavlova_lutheri.AAC.10
MWNRRHTALHHRVILAIGIKRRTPFTGRGKEPAMAFLRLSIPHDERSDVVVHVAGAPGAK